MLPLPTSEAPGVQVIALLGLQHAYNLSQTGCVQLCLFSTNIDLGACPQTSGSRSCNTVLLF